MDPGEGQPLNRTKLFALDEYRSATIGFIEKAVHAIVYSDGLLAQISRERVGYVTTTQNTLDDGQVVESDPVLVSAQGSFSTADGIAGDFDEIHVAISQIAEEFGNQMTKKMISDISSMCDTTGNVVPSNGRSFWDSYLEALETIALKFGSDGKPELPQVALHPDTADRMDPPPADFQQRVSAVMERRQDEWLAKRRARRLPRIGN